MNTAIILGFILHMIGDYLFQNNWLAVEKTKAHLPALIHASIYSAPFLFLVPGFWWIPVIVTHFFIDRYRLAVYWIKLVNWNWDSKNYGYPDQMPLWLSTWLLFIIDNIFHISINTLSIIAHYKL